MDQSPTFIIGALVALIFSFIIIMPVFLFVSSAYAREFPLTIIYRRRPYKLAGRIYSSTSVVQVPILVGNLVLFSFLTTSFSKSLSPSYLSDNFWSNCIGSGHNLHYSAFVAWCASILCGNCWRSTRRQLENSCHQCFLRVKSASELSVDLPFRNPYCSLL